MKDKFCNFSNNFFIICKYFQYGPIKSIVPLLASGSKFEIILNEPFSKQQISDSPKLKEFADNNFKFDENGRQFSKRVENTVGKRRNCSIGAISPFPTVCLKDLYCRYVKTRACVVKD